MVRRASEAVDTVVQTVLGEACWGVRSHGTGLVLNFGDPHLEVREPCVVPDALIASLDERTRKEYERRKLLIFGAWHLVVWRRGLWSIELGATIVKSSSKLRDVLSAMDELDSQTLLRISVDPRNARTRWFFTGDVVLTIKRGTHRDRDLWSFFTPNRRVLTVRGDAHYALKRSDTAGDHARWMPL